MSCLPLGCFANPDLLSAAHTPVPAASVTNRKLTPFEAQVAIIMQTVRETMATSPPVLDYATLYAGAASAADIGLRLVRALGALVQQHVMVPLYSATQEGQLQATKRAVEKLVETFTLVEASRIL